MKPRRCRSINPHQLRVPSDSLGVSNERGFTLIELLVVVLIITLLAAAVPMFLRQ